MATKTCSQCNEPGHNKRTCSQKAKSQTEGYIEVVKEMGAEQRSAPRRKSKLDAETQEAIEWYLDTRYPWRKELGPAKALTTDEEE